MKPWKVKREKQHRRAVATVELAVVLPLIVLFLAFVLELGRVMMLQHTVDSAAYEAARSAMVPGATAAQAQQTAQLLINAAGLQQANIVVTPSVLSETTPLITVEVSVPVNLNSWIAPRYFGDFAVASEVSLVCERPPIVRLSAIDELGVKKAALQAE